MGVVIHGSNDGFFFITITCARWFPFLANSPLRLGGSNYYVRKGKLFEN